MTIIHIDSLELIEKYTLKSPVCDSSSPVGFSSGQQQAVIFENAYENVHCLISKILITSLILFDLKRSFVVSRWLLHSQQSFHG